MYTITSKLIIAELSFDSKISKDEGLLKPRSQGISGLWAMLETLHQMKSSPVSNPVMSDETQPLGLHLPPNTLLLPPLGFTPAMSHDKSR